MVSFSRYFTVCITYQPPLVVPASHSAHDISITVISLLLLFREVISVYSENHTKHTNTLCGKV